MATGKLVFSVNAKLCKKCGICYSLCPKGVLKAGADGCPEAVAPENCIFCNQCEMRCPDFVIRVGRNEE